MEVEILVAEVGADAEDDQVFHILYDGSVVDEDRYSVIGGDAEAIGARLEDGVPARPRPGGRPQRGRVGALAGPDRTLAARRPRGGGALARATAAGPSVGSRTTSSPRCCLRSPHQNPDVLSPPPGVPFVTIVRIAGGWWAWRCWSSTGCPSGTTQGGGEVVALDGVDLAVDEGESSRSSARAAPGKSTLLHLAGGLDRRTPARCASATATSATHGGRRAMRSCAAARSASSSSSSTCSRRSRSRRTWSCPLLLDGGASASGASASCSSASGSATRADHQPGAAVRRRDAAHRDRPRAGRRPAPLLADEPTGNLDSAIGGRHPRPAQRGGRRGGRRPRDGHP